MDVALAASQVPGVGVSEPDCVLARSIASHWRVAARGIPTPVAAPHPREIEKTPAVTGVKWKRARSGGDIFGPFCLPGSL
jgi:hypothetical protein